MMGRVAIVTDTVANLPTPLYDELDIRVVPQIVIFGEASYREGIDISIEAFYARLRAADPLPITSRPTPQSYLEAFRACAQAEAILVLTPSAHLSGAYDAAGIAAREFEQETGHPAGGGRVILLDTRTAALAQGLLVLEAARLARRGGTVEQIRSYVEALRSRIALYGAIPTLQYLQRTGRVGRAAATVGALLQIKPIITVGPDGVIDTADRVRSWGRALDRLVELVALDRPHADSRLHLGVIHADAADEGHRLEERLVERFKPSETYFTYCTPAVATHTGPGLIAITYWWE